MNPKFRKQILCRLPYMAQNTANISNLFVNLIALSVIDIRERDNAASHPSDFDKCVDLCSIIIGKHDSVFEKFLDGLKRSWNVHVAEKISHPLSEEEEKQSMDECLYSLNMVMKGSSAERKLHFFQTLNDQNILVFEHIGKPARSTLRKKPVYYSYYILNQNGDRLFRLNWEYVEKYGARPMRFCRNLLGETVMEMDTPFTSKCVSVGEDFIGSVKMGEYSWIALSSFKILNATNERVYNVKLTGSATDLYAKWNVYDTQLIEIAQFGWVIKGRNQKYKVGLVYLSKTFTAWEKALLFGAAIIIMDRSKKGSLLAIYWRKYKFLAYSFICGLVLSAIPVMLYLFPQ